MWLGRFGLPAKTELDLCFQPKQAELRDIMRATGKSVPTRIGWGGSRGAAKSGGLRRICLAMRFLYPGTTGWIVRKIWEDLRINHVERYFDEFPWLEQYYNGSNKEIELPNKSVIGFRHAESLKRVRQKFMGTECHDLYIDQAEQFSEEELILMPTTVRMPGEKPGECKTSFFFNPGGPGTEYLRRVFHLKQFKGKERPGNFQFIQAYGWDNYEWFRESGIDLTPEKFYSLPSEDRFEMFINDTNYGRELNELPPSLRAGHLLGSFDSFAGQYYTAVWNEDLCVETQDRVELMMQPWWPKWLATDWGFSHYMPTLWATTGKLSPAQFKILFGIETEWPIDIVVIYRQLVINETAEGDAAELIADGGDLEDGTHFSGTPEDEREMIQHHYFSVEELAKKGHENSRSDLMDPILRRAGMPAMEAADNDRVDGWRLIFALLKQTCSLRSVKEGKITKEMAQRGPMLIIGANCEDVIAAIPLAMRSEKDSEDVEKTSTRADDVLDCLRYLLKSYLRPRKRAPKDVRAREVASQHTDMTEKAMAMRKFEAAEKQHRKRRGRWSLR